jgi:macrolide-specific efflux system membrane fusion protein
MKLRLAAIALILVGVGAVAFAVVGPTFGASSSSKYLTATVATGTVSAQSVATGTVAASTVYGFKFGATPDIVSSVATTSGSGGATSSNSTSGQSGSSLIWPVQNIAVTVGMRVTKGTVLATADPTAAQLQLTSAKATLSSAKARLIADVSQADAVILADQAQVATSQATVNADQAIADAATLTAPADGLIIAVNILPGVNAPSGEAIEESVGPMVATAGFAESDIAKLQIGQSASVAINGSSATPVAGTLTQIVPVASTSGGSSSVATFAVTITLTSPPATVLAGMSATVTVTTASVDNVLRVPATALSGSASAGYSVIVMNADGSTATQSVTVGLVTTQWAEIKSGLRAGETVVTGTTAARSGTTTTGNGGVNVNSLTGGGGVPGGGFGR